MVSARGEYPLLQTLFDHLVHHLVHQVLKLPEWSKILTRASQNPQYWPLSTKILGFWVIMGIWDVLVDLIMTTLASIPHVMYTRVLVLGFKGPLQGFYRDMLQNVASCLKSLIPII